MKHTQATEIGIGKISGRTKGGKKWKFEDRIGVGTLPYICKDL